MTYNVTYGFHALLDAFRLIGEPSTDPLGGSPFTLQATPPGAIIEVELVSGVGARFRRRRCRGGPAEMAVLRSAIDEASRYMLEHPEKRTLCRAV